MTVMETAVESVALLPVGTLTIDQSILTYRRGPGEKVECPVICVFIEMADGEHILFDTGPPPSLLDGTDKLSDHQRQVVCSYTEEDDLRHRLKSLGHEPGDVKLVINSHFHWDHSGGNYLFDHARVMVQAKEVRFAGMPDAFVDGAYTAALYETAAERETLSGDRMIRPGVLAIATPGHTPGHQSLLIALPSGRAMILTGDAMFCPANIDPAIPPGNAHTPADAIASIQRLKALAEFHGGDLVICHDPGLWDTWRPAPHRYT